MHPAEQINKSNLQIVEGKYDEAIISLTAALKTVQLALSGDAKVSMSLGYHDGECQEELGPCNPSSSSSLACYEYEYLSSVDKPSFLNTPSIISIHKNFCTASDDSMIKDHSPTHIQFKLFQEPLKVIVCKPLDTSVCKELAYITIYNLALSHHLKFFEKGLLSRPESRRKFLDKALALYQHAQLILREQEVRIRHDTTHSMAFISSLLHIHFELGNFRKAEACAQCLISTIICTICNGERDATSNPMEGFLDMVLPLISKNITARAA